MNAKVIDNKSQYNFVKDEIDSFEEKSFAINESSRKLSLAEGKKLAFKLIEQ